MIIMFLIITIIKILLTFEPQNIENRDNCIEPINIVFEKSNF